MRICFALLCLVATTFASTTTHHPHHTHTHEPNEGEAFTFAYNGRSHDLVIKHRSGKNYMCYIASLTDDERHTVHTDGGMRAVELRILGLLSSSTVVEKTAIDQVNLKYCGHAPHNGTMIYHTIP
ncbi:uncharacterized protein LOC123537378 [Mercenaria mercenaria]|uniref:uncharacterized protein LOC123537378 n=1 Tax=Mercenaria mercenaria TaxID=6596 RepID=UPI00234EA831|nr:uncharacterized protein LOC123537378 [Mercenaria mercenaria]